MEDERRGLKASVFSFARFFLKESERGRVVASCGRLHLHRYRRLSEKVSDLSGEKRAS